MDSPHKRASTGDEWGKRTASTSTGRDGHCVPHFIPKESVCDGSRFAAS